jgi:hypothetical protein
MKRECPQLAIGPVRFAFEGAVAPGVRYPGWAYRDFFGRGCVDAVSMVQVTLPVSLMDGKPVLPSRTPDFAADRNWTFWDEGDVLRFCSGFAGREIPRFACEVGTDMMACRLFVDGDVTDAPLRYPLDQVLTWGLLGRCNGILLHAAAVVCDGAGYVLAGRSGAGKSTLSGFCQDAGWEVLNDDRVILHPDPLTGRWLVSGTPWHGSGAFASNRTVPLQGIYLLEQSARNAMRPLPGREARMEMLDVAAIAWFSEGWSQVALDAVERVSRDVPVFRFCFQRSVAALSLFGLEVAA